MRTRFNSIKSTSYGWFFFVSSLVIVSAAIVAPVLSKQVDKSIALLIGIPLASLICGFFLWYWLDTWYAIEENILFIKGGPFSWKININQITKIRLNQITIGGTIKPTLSRRSMIIYYKKYNSIYISPERQEEFLKMLRAVNSAIMIKN